MTKILLVDDEPDACEMLQILITKHIRTPTEIVICNSPEQAIKVIASFKPELLLLDIEMPNMNGFDLLNRIGSWDFDVIFTTAYDKYAIKAIRFSALDYLLKPIDIVDLQNAVNRHIVKKDVQPQLQQQLVSNLISNLKQKDQNDFKLAISTSEGVYFSDPRNIIRLEGEGNYTRFFFSDRKPLLVAKVIKDYEEILQGYSFIRIHKSYLVNRHHISQMDKDDMLRLSDGSHIAISRRRKEDVMQLLNAREKK
ncbi:MAG: response regulator transcription factor [Chitinophagaceae bacterium]|nr:response regulator transcription factor [Chitinophagaceae bacterium]